MRCNLSTDRSASAESTAVGEQFRRPEVRSLMEEKQTNCDRRDTERQSYNGTPQLVVLTQPKVHGAFNAIERAEGPGEGGRAYPSDQMTEAWHTNGTCPVIPQEWN